MNGHLETWKAFLRSLTTVPAAQVEALSEALALAAPSGPVGFECVDMCRCDQARLDALLQSLLDHRHPACYDMKTWKQMQIDLQKAMLQDRKNCTRQIITSDMMRDLGDIGTIVSRNSARVALARGVLPHTWTVIEVYGR